MQFQLIQAAYAVLSDAHERQWYVAAAACAPTVIERSPPPPVVSHLALHARDLQLDASVREHGVTPSNDTPHRAAPRNATPHLTIPRRTAPTMAC
jgi:hypothetical protein